MAEKSVVRQSFPVAAAAFASLVFALVVRDLRTEHRNASIGILISIGQPLVLGLIFYFLIDLFSIRGSLVRGDDLTFVMSGFVLFFLHLRTAGAVAGALKKDMMKHARATPFLLVAVKAVSAAYNNLLALIILMLANYLLRGVFELHDPLKFIAVLFWCWLGGVAVGMIFMALKHYFTWGKLAENSYARIMFLTSGKFFVANTIAPSLRAVLEWNPLFHLLDQGRDAIFLNYTAKTTSFVYPIAVILFLLALGFLAEHHVRRNYNASHFPR